MYNKELAHSVSTNGAIVFGQLCSSYESFGSKDMLTIKDEKEYFFLTSEALEGETALTYKQQLKAIKDLEREGYIETRLMGVPSKKFFHITNKIVDELFSEVNPRSDKREGLDTSRVAGRSSLDKRENLDMTKGKTKPDQKGNLKINNKKEQCKDINNLVNKDSANNDHEETINRLVKEYRLKGLSKEVCLKVVDETMEKEGIESFGGYLRRSLENTLYKHRLKRGEIDSLQKKSLFGYDWLNA